MEGRAAPSRARQAIRAGDVLVSTVRPNLNAVAIVPQVLDGEIASTGFCVLRPKQSELSERYLFYYCCTPAFIDALVAKVRGAQYPAASDADVKAIEVQLPPLTEQCRIVEILDHADRLRRLRAEADAKADRILPALFIKMFGDPGTNPRGWPVRPVRDLCDVVSGATPRTDRPEYWGGGIYWATPKDLSVLDDFVLEATERTITEEGLASCSARMLPPGAVLLSSRAPIGLVAVAGAQMCTNQGFKSLVCRSEADPWYVFAWCKMRSGFLQSLGRGATFGEISKAIVESVEIPVPPPDLQRQFGSRIRELRVGHLKRRDGRQVIEVLFKTLLSHAFAGDLTASWREAHMKDLLQEMEHQAKALAATARPE